MRFKPFPHLKLDGAVFAKALVAVGTPGDQTPRLCGIRYEHRKLCLEDDAVLELLTDAAVHLARCSSQLWSV